MNNEPVLSQSSKGKLRHLPTYEEVDKMATEAFPVAGGMCRTLCNEYQDTADRLQDAPPQLRARLIARLKALATQMKALHCPTCLLE